MLKNGRVAARLPAQDLERARAFYAEKLGTGARGGARELSNNDRSKEER